MNSLPSRSIIEYDHFHSCELERLTGQWWNQLADFDQCYFESPWSKTSWEQLRFDCQYYSLSIMRAKQRPEGFALWWHAVGDDLAHLLKIIVRNPGQGHGSTLLTASLQSLIQHGVKKIYLEVHAGNQRAINFYQKWGWAELPRKKHFYSATHPLGAGDARIFGGTIGQL